jgi:acyl transferase domain-containing protein/acyl carrier protein
MRPHENSGESSLFRRALKTIEALQARVAELENAGRDPVAVIGMACRFPGGVHDAESYWKLLEEGVDAVREAPRNRWDLSRYYDADPSVPGKMYTRRGGFLDGLEMFDAAFFHISPREAKSLDPQHRLLLETAWEALENAGIAPLSLKGKPAGIFAGLCSGDYAQLLSGRDESEIDAWLATGTTHSMAVGRLSYVFGSTGPNLAVDTACSSSLAAVHLAMQSLRSGESSIALAGGVNCILTPEHSINFCKANMLSPEGRCSTFDVSANGFVRGEGAGMVALKRLSHALRDGDRVLAVLRGSAMNQDGHTSGPTVPSGPAQQALIRKALADAGLKPGDVGYIEAHGTGTALGDPIEGAALSEVFGAEHSAERPLFVGSVKTNFGHLEGAAGIAGLIKAVLTLQRRSIPGNLHFRSLSPHIAWPDGLQVARAMREWKSDRLRVAGVSSFGFSGTNVHVVVQEGPEQSAPVVTEDREWHVLTLSAGSETALRKLASEVAALENRRLPDVAFTMNCGRSHFAHRLAVVARDWAEATERIRAFDNAAFVEEGVERGARFEFSGKAGEAVCRKVQALYLAGTEIDWEAWDRGFARRKLALPTYPFERRRHWYREEAQVDCDFAYEIQWKALPRGRLPDPVELLSTLRCAPAATSDGLLSDLEALSAAYAAIALEKVSPERVAQNRRRLFARLRNVASPLAGMPDPDALMASHPEALAELQLLARCGANLAAVLTGEWGSVETLFAGEASPDKIYRDSPSSLAVNLLAREAIENVANQWPGERPLRILEAGAGTGGTTAHLLDALPKSGVKYLFTDVTRAFLVRARERFAAAAFLRFEVFDVENEPEAQGFGALSQDVIVAANVLHATKDLKQSLRHLRRLLAPGGLLLLIEVVRPQTWLDVTFGLLDGWWRFEDTELRASHPLLEAAQWRALLAECEFESAASVETGEGSLLRQGLIAARANTAASLVWECRNENPAEACGELLELVRGTARPIQLVLRDPNRMVDAALRGFGRVVGLEHPESWAGIVHGSQSVTCPGEKELLIRDGQSFAPRIVRIPSRTTAQEHRFRPEASYLITGGLGFLGLRLARWMAARGAAKIVLMGRSGTCRAVVEELRSSGVRVEIVRGDAGIRSDIARAVEAAGSLGPLRGVVHMAARGNSQPLLSLNLAEIEAEFAPKLSGALALHERTQAMDLDFFVLCSSASSVWGAKGQAHYAAANSCLDRLAHERRRAGLKALSVSWGLLSGGGMVSEEYRGWLTRAGVEPLDAEEGFDALFRLVDRPAAHVLLARVDWRKFAEVYGAREYSSLFEELIAPSPEVKTEVAAPANEAPRFQEMGSVDRRSGLVDFVTEQFCRTLGLPASEAPGLRQGFFDAGMDSLLAIEFRDRLQKDLGVALPSTVAFNYPNVESMAGHLDHLLGPADEMPAENEVDAQIAALLEDVQSLLQEEAL